MKILDALSAQPTTRAILETFRSVMPRILLAVVVVVAGWIIARVLRAMVRRLLGRWHPRPTGGPAGAGWAEIVDEGRPGQLIGGTVYWIVMLAAIMTATEVLGLRVITTGLTSAARHIPRLLAAALLVIAASVGSKLLGRAVVRAAAMAGSPYAARLGSLAQMVLIAAAVLMALQQIGVDVSLITTTLLIVLAALVAGTALAFGLGARPFVAQILAMHYVQKTFQIGDRIRAQDAEGRIIRFTSTAVILDCEEGETSLPALDLTTRPSLRLPREA